MTIIGVAIAGLWIFNLGTIWCFKVVDRRLTALERDRAPGGEG